MDCPYCGETNLKPGIEKCPNCGVVLGVRKLSGCWSGWLAIIVGLVGCLTIAWGYFGKFAAAVSKNNPNPADDMLIQTGYACIGVAVLFALYYLLRRVMKDR